MAGLQITANFILFAVFLTCKFCYNHLVCNTARWQFIVPHLIENLGYKNKYKKLSVFNDRKQKKIGAHLLQKYENTIPVPDKKCEHQFVGVKIDTEVIRNSTMDS